jgi:hypothetical protein
MKLCILDNITYTVILKTYWLRIIQRHWRKAFSIRDSIIKKRMRLNVQRNFELKGNYGYGLNTMPTIHGLLSVYK